jgi:hypothetical protein
MSWVEKRDKDFMAIRSKKKFKSKKSGLKILHF